MKTLFDLGLSTIADIKEYLKKNGYQGLAYDECGCSIEDLAPCGEGCLDCYPAYLMECINKECGLMDDYDGYYVALKDKNEEVGCSSCMDSLRFQKITTEVDNG